MTWTGYGTNRVRLILDFPCQQVADLAAPEGNPGDLLATPFSKHWAARGGLARKGLAGLFSDVVAPIPEEWVFTFLPVALSPVLGFGAGIGALLAMRGLFVAIHVARQSKTAGGRLHTFREKALIPILASALSIGAFLVYIQFGAVGINAVFTLGSIALNIFGFAAAAHSVLNFLAPLLDRWTGKDFQKASLWFWRKSPEALKVESRKLALQAALGQASQTPEEFQTVVKIVIESLLNIDPIGRAAAHAALVDHEMTAPIIIEMLNSHLAGKPKWSRPIPDRPELRMPYILQGDERQAYARRTLAPTKYEDALRKAPDMFGEYQEKMLRYERTGYPEHLTLLAVWQSEAEEYERLIIVLRDMAIAIGDSDPTTVQAILDIIERCSRDETQPVQQAAAAALEKLKGLSLPKRER